MNYLKNYLQKMMGNKDQIKGSKTEPAGNMLSNPYRNLPDCRFWKKGVELSDPLAMDNIHTPQLEFSREDVIVTMGSCFAQHIANWLRAREFNVPFYDTTDNIKAQSFSANYGNIYSVRQGLQLLREITGQHKCSEPCWHTEGGLLDPLRPNIFAQPFQSHKDVDKSRKDHLEAVRQAFGELDLLVMTLGLTEAWRIRECGTVLPTAPGVLGGKYVPDHYEFVNFRYSEILADLESLCKELTQLRGGRSFRMIVTVSPVPLTATAEDRHILSSSVYSKSVLRAVAGDFCADHDFAEYFPSFEIINNPAARSAFFEDNFRGVKTDSVATVMGVFERAYIPENEEAQLSEMAEIGDVDCEDLLLEAFADTPPIPTVKSATAPPLLVVGNSHLASARRHMEKNPFNTPVQFAMMNFLEKDPFATVQKTRFRSFTYRDDVQNKFEDVVAKQARTLILIGCGFMGDAVVRAHGALTAGRPDIDPRSVSPNLPIVDGVDEKLITSYDKATAPLVEIAFDLEKFTDFDEIYWVAAGDPTEAAARVRLGNEYVDSGSHVFHKEAYRLSLKRISNRLKKITFITHPLHELCEPNGFTKNEHRANDVAWDIHCGTSYYDIGMKTLWERMRAAGHHLQR
jgi:hypothetical protein